jgi:uncharacterized protein (TIGR03032 family)
LSVDVFISYARVDDEAADRIAVALQTVGLEVWWDAMLQPGEVFDEKIQNVVAEAKVFVGVLSPTSLLSDWVRWELSQAVTNGLHVIPMLVDGLAPEQLAPPLSLVHAIMIPELEPGVLREAAVQTSSVVRALRRRVTGDSVRDRDARSRLAQAAAATASQANHIRQRNGRAERDSQPARRSGLSASPGFAGLLDSLELSLAITSPDGGQLFFVGCDSTGELSIAAADFDGPTGVCASDGSLVLATRNAIVTLRNVLHPEQLYGGRFSHLFVARTSQFLGALSPHDVAIADDIYFVSSRYSCVAAPSSIHSFSLEWLPSFVTEVVPEDRCHLNGLAVENGELAYATAFGVSNSIDGWRDGRVGGGVALSIRTGEIVCEGLTMPHSPRVHDDRLWLLNSGAGQLGCVRTASSGVGIFEVVASVPGFARGLALVGPFAFCGVSRSRHESFAGLELDDRFAGDHPEARTGVAVIDTRSGDCIEWLWLEGASREVYDIVALPGVRSATAFPADSTEALGLVTMDP